MNLIAQKGRSGEKKALFKCFNHYKNPEECKHYHAMFYDELYDEILERIKQLFEEIKDSPLFENLSLKLLELKKVEKTKNEKGRTLKELATVKTRISNIRKSSSRNGLAGTAVLGELKELVDKQLELTQHFTWLERGEINGDINHKEIDDMLNDFLNIQILNESIVSQLIKKIEIGEIVVTEKGPRRDIIITYSFGKFSK